MAVDNDEEPVSGFIRPDDILTTDSFTEFRTIPNRGYNLLVRAKRYGRWWMLKGLKEPYRNDTVYQILLHKEYEIISQMQHPMVVSVFSFEEVENLGLCIVMEWIDGLTLKEWLTSVKHSLKERQHVADMLFEALTYIQSRQTQHRDLKPSNIMLTHDGLHLKLIDFGLSDTNSHTVLKASVGTEGYMAPDGPSDIYSLGRILRELRVGRFSCIVIRKCCAPKKHRYANIATIQRNMHRCWQWPRRLFVILCLVALIAGFYLLNVSRAQQGLKTVSDSLKLFRAERNADLVSEQAKIDSLQLQINGQQKTIQPIGQKTFNSIEAKKKEIDQRAQAYGIEEMLDTVCCQTNITIPMFRILDELENSYEEPELKQYIRMRYRIPWEKRMLELPFK